MTHIKITQARDYQPIYGYWIVIALLLILLLFNSYIALRNAKPVCDDLRVVQINEYTRTLECVYDLGDTQEDSVDVIIRN